MDIVRLDWILWASALCGLLLVFCMAAFVVGETARYFIGERRGMALLRRIDWFVLIVATLSAMAIGIAQKWSGVGVVQAWTFAVIGLVWGTATAYKPLLKPRERDVVGPARLVQARADPPPHFGSGCMRCRAPWLVRDGHSTSYGKGRGMFPLCELCWQRLTTPERRFPYYAALRDEWIRQGATGDEAPTDAELMRALQAEIGRG